MFGKKNRHFSDISQKYLSQFSMVDGQLKIQDKILSSLKVFSRLLSNGQCGVCASIYDKIINNHAFKYMNNSKKSKNHLWYANKKIN